MNAALASDWMTDEHQFSKLDIIINNAYAMHRSRLPRLASERQICRDLSDFLSSILVTVFHICFVVGFLRFLRLVELDRVVDVAQDAVDTILILHIQSQVRDHAEIINQSRDGLVQPLEAVTLHHRLRIDHRALAIVRLPIGRVVVQKRGIRVQEALELPLSHLALHQIHLGQDVDMRHLQHDHGTHRAQGAGEKLGAVHDEGRLQQVGGAQADVQRAGARQVPHEGRQDGDVGVQLDLARHVDDDEVLLRQRVEGLGEEVQVLHEELEAVDQAAVGAEPHLLHDILERDQVLDVQVRLVREILGGGVEVHVEAGAAVVAQVRDEG